MTSIDASLAETGDARSAARRDAATALVATLIVVAIYALQGFPTLSDANGDNDSLMRLVEVRDLIAGQGWFDLHQYRMGPPGGFVMHWSRLVDTPLALLVLAALSLGAGPESAATVAGLVWPLFLFGLALFIILRIVRELASEWAILPTAVVAGVALYVTGNFLPGNIDHHSVQLVLTLAMLAFLSDRRRSFADGAAAGGFAALMMAVGMETLPYVAAGGIVTALSMAFTGGVERRRAAGLGTGLAGVSFVVMVTTIAPSQWLAARCDAFSVVQFAAAAIAGGGLALASLMPLAAHGRVPRLAMLGLLAALLLLLVIVFFPQCLADPYSAVDPQLRAIWLDRIAEVQPFTRVFTREPALAMASFATPFLALLLLAAALVRGRLCVRWLPVAAVLATAFVISLWQLRGTMFSVPLASIVLGAWVGRARARAAASGAAAGQAMALGAWVLSVPLVWSMATFAFGQAFAGTSGAHDEATATASCYRGSDYQKLAALPATTVMAPSNLGAAILRYTDHRTLAGPYHRDTAGIEAAFAVFMATPEKAQRLVRRNHATLVAICPGNAESGLIASSAPHGLMARLLDQSVPAWLQPLDQEGALRIYAVRAAATGASPAAE